MVIQILQEQQQELFNQLPRAQQKAFGLQNAVTRKFKPSKLLSVSPVYSYFKRKQIRQEIDKSGTFGEKIAVDMPRPKIVAPKQNLADPLGIR